MDYEKAYKDALERARGHHGVAIHYGKTEEIQELEYIFPELAESEDERIRKEMIEALKQLDREKSPVDTYQYQEWIAYLEKQKEQKPAEWSEEDEIKFEHILAIINVESREPEENKKLLTDFIKSLRPQPHWKPSEKQMEWLESAVRLSTDKPHIHGTIISLYEQLKRL